MEFFEDNDICETVTIDDEKEFRELLDYYPCLPGGYIRCH